MWLLLGITLTRMNELTRPHYYIFTALYQLSYSHHGDKRQDSNLRHQAYKAYVIIDWFAVWVFKNGSGWTRTNEALPQEIYSLPPLPLGTHSQVCNYPSPQGEPFQKFFILVTEDLDYIVHRSLTWMQSSQWVCSLLAPSSVTGATALYTLSGESRESFTDKGWVGGVLLITGDKA